MTEQEPEPSPEPAIGSLEWETGRRAAQMLAQDRARETLRKQEPEPVTAQWDPEADGRRATALQQAYAARGAVRMGRDVSGSAVVLPNGALAAVRWKENTDLIAEISPGVLTQTLIRPHEWDEHDREWQAQRRLEENTVLALAWGRGRCVAEGWFTAAEAMELPPEPPPNPNGPPYRIENSVR